MRPLYGLRLISEAGGTFHQLTEGFTKTLVHTILCLGEIFELRTLSDLLHSISTGFWQYLNVYLILKHV